MFMSIEVFLMSMHDPYERGENDRLLTPMLSSGVCFTRDKMIVCFPMVVVFCLYMMNNFPCMHCILFFANS